MNIHDNIEKIKTIKEEIRAALNNANIITPPTFPFSGYERQIRRVSDEQLPNFFYTLDSNNNVEKIIIIFDENVHYYNIWLEKGSNVELYPKYRLIYQGSLDLNLAKNITSWNSEGLEYLEANNKEIIYTGSNPYDFNVKEFKFPELKIFSFARNFASSAIFFSECFPKIEEFSGNVCQNDTEAKASIILPNLKTFNGYICPNAITEEVFLNNCTDFTGKLAKGRIYHFESLGKIVNNFLSDNNILERVYMGVVSESDVSTPFANVDKKTFILYVKRGSDENIINKLTDMGIQVMYYA